MKVPSVLSWSTMLSAALALALHAGCASLDPESSPAPASVLPNVPRGITPFVPRDPHRILPRLSHQGPQCDSGPNPGPAGAKLTYYGGPVLATVRVYAVFWGPSVNSTTKAGIGNFYNGVTNSAYFDWLSEYNANGMHIGRGSYAGAVTIQPGATGDTTSLYETMKTAVENIAVLKKDPVVAEKLDDDVLVEWVADKGYHSNDTISTLAELGMRSYIAEPKRGRRNWHGDEATRDAVYANRRRIRGSRGRALMRRRGEYLERPFAHCLLTGGMRRVFLRGCENIAKRYLVHVAGANLGLMMRSLFGVGTPRSLQGLAAGVSSACEIVIAGARALVAHFAAVRTRFLQPDRLALAA